MPWTWDVTVVLDLPLDQARRRVAATLAELEAHEGRTLLRLRAESLEWAASVLAGLDCPFAIVAPDELRDSVRALGRRLVTTADD